MAVITIFLLIVAIVIIVILWWKNRKITIAGNKSRFAEEQVQHQQAKITHLLETLGEEREKIASLYDTVRNREDQLIAKDAELSQARQELAVRIVTHPHTPTDLRKAQLKSNQGSRSAISGQTAEKLWPFSLQFLNQYNPRDMRFVGDPIDYIIFNGVYDEEEPEVEVIIIEVKTGRSALSKRQRRIRDAVESGRVQWAEVHFDIPEITHNVMPTAETALPPALSVPVNNELPSPRPPKTAVEDISAWQNILGD